MKKISILFWLPVFTIFSTFSSNTDRYYFKHINTESGLSQNTVLSIYQDKTGFMWFGTKDGLNRYDGNAVKVFKQDSGDAKSIGNNTIWSLLEVPDGSLWIGTDRGIYIYHPSDESFSYLDVKTQNNESIKYEVLDMKLDQSGNIWIVSNKLFLYSLHTGKLELVVYNHKAPSFSRPWSVNVDRDNRVWISILYAGIKCYDPADNKFKYYTKDADGKDFSQSLISKTINPDNNSLLIGSFNDKLRVLDKTTEEIRPYSLGKAYEDNLFVRSMEKFSDGNIWIGTESGLYIHNPELKQTTHLYHNINDRYSLSDNAVYSLYEDREGGIWVGTYFGGVNYYPRPYNYFEMYYPITNQNSITGERVSGICEDPSGNIWIGTEDAGLNKWDIKTGQFTYYPPGKGLNYHNVHDIISDGDLLWIGTFSHGINVYNLKTNQWKYYTTGDKEGTITNDDIFALFKDSRGNIWVGTSSGAFLYHRESDRFLKHEKPGDHFISDIIEDASGQIWFSSFDCGVFCYNPRTETYKNYNHDPTNPQSICYHKIISMYLDSKKRIWFASESNGICLFDEQTRQFIRYGEKDGFSNSVIYKIIEDDDHNLWLSSNMGLMRFNPETKNIRIFTKNNGFPGNQFNYKSGYKDKTGKIYFGSVNGLIVFQPSKFNMNEHLPPVIITDIHLLNNQNILLNKQLNKPSITLKHNQSSFSISFTALSFVAPEMNRYAYKMEKLDEQWNYTTSSQQITYSNLTYGKYIFKVKASNNDGLWNETGTMLTINILPPFWKTQWAYITYLLLFILSIYFSVNYFRRKIELKNERKQALFENKKEKEIYDAKLNFFTNIAHEIRTPLTLIKGPLEYILKTELKREELNTHLLIMEKNTNRLLSLINQLLDFRKTELKGFSLSFVKININELLQETYIRFQQTAEQKELNFTITLAEQQILADVDKEALIKIISNLFSNALKYAASFIRVTLHDFPEQFAIKVQNDGNKIPAELNQMIFKPFFQINKEDKVKQGSGIGLALVKSLVDLHAGNVFLEDVAEEFNTFVVILPKCQPYTIDLEKYQPVLSKKENSETKWINVKQQRHVSTLLIVEDNEEMIQFIASQLNAQYNILKAGNGMEAIRFLDKYIINLIISDIMMPQMDGLELCAKVKKSQEYSHIPIILLTAKTTLQSKISGLELGADAYIEKPFSWDYLQAQISNLLDNRKKIKEAFSHSPFVHTKSIALNKADEQFLNKATDIIYKNIFIPDFNVDQLAEALCMSRSSLLRKIKGVSEFTPNDFIRLIRLKRAAEILQDGEYKVNEVCYLVGFSSPSYFTKAFHKQFGILPKDFGKA
jgi:ligand-binding sensor domain-containing protein/signal transduction histidine kinase/DNA-binding response OmpR family regulator